MNPLCLPSEVTSSTRPRRRARRPGQVAERRDRAEDGFPLFGDGSGGWFGVSATVRFEDGSAETFSRRVELPEAP